MAEGAMTGPKTAMVLSDGDGFGPLHVPLAHRHHRTTAAKVAAATVHGACHARA